METLPYEVLYRICLYVEYESLPALWSLFYSVRTIGYDKHFWPDRLRLDFGLTNQESKPRRVYQDIWYEHNKRLWNDKIEALKSQCDLIRDKMHEYRRLLWEAEKQYDQCDALIGQYQFEKDSVDEHILTERRRKFLPRHIRLDQAQTYRFPKAYELNKLYKFNLYHKLPFKLKKLRQKMPEVIFPDDIAADDILIVSHMLGDVLFVYSHRNKLYVNGTESPYFPEEAHDMFVRYRIHTRDDLADLYMRDTAVGIRIRGVDYDFPITLENDVKRIASIPKEY